MKCRVSKTGIKLNIVYAVLVLLAFIFLFATIETNAFAYIYLIFLTIPWSLILAVIALLHESVGEMSPFCKMILFGVPGWPPKIPHLWPLENPPPGGCF